MKELRIGLVLYGGVSLAVYMNGISTELWSALRASRFRSDADAAANGGAAAGGGAAGAGALPGTPAVYRDLLHELAALDGAENLRIVVDAVAGTSAGGVNGAALARAIADGADAAVLNRVWIEEADISALRSSPAQAPWWLRSLSWIGGRFKPLAALREKMDSLPGLSWAWLRDSLYALFTTTDGQTTPLNGRYFTKIIATSLADMRKGGDGKALLPERGTFDLFLTRTDLHGWPRHLPVTPSLHHLDLFERTHAHVMAFRHRPDGTAIGDDFDLTFAARTTAGFPGAFAPVSYTEVAADYRAARPGDAVPPLADFERRHLREHMLSTFPGQHAWMIDGGVLDNRPFSHVADAIEEKPADRQVYRIVVYIEPDPETEIDRSPTRMPLPLHVLKGLFPLFRHEPVYGDLHRLEERNSKVEKIQSALAANLPRAAQAAEDLGAKAGLPWPPAPGDLDAWRRLTNEAAARDPLSGYAGYVQIKLRAAADTLSEVICRALDYPYHCRHAFFVRNLVRLWLQRMGGRLEAPAGDDGLTEGQQELLKAFDIPFRIRRIRALVQAVNEGYGDLPVADAAARAEARRQLDACKRALADILFGYEALLSGSAETRRRISEGLGDIEPDAIDRMIAALQLDPARVIADYAEPLERVYRALVGQFTETAVGLNRRLAAAVGGLPPGAYDRVARRFVAFAFTDIALYPMMNLLGVTDLAVVNTMRISPQDATFLSQDPHRLKGRELGAFAAFLERHAREHDLMWGRLDGAERLIALIVAAAASETADRDRLEALRRRYTARAMDVILREEAARQGSRIGETIAALQRDLAKTG